MSAADVVLWLHTRAPTPHEVAREPSAARWIATTAALPALDAARAEAVEPLFQPADSARALALLDLVNAARAPDGRRYADLVDVAGFRPWWFNLQIALDAVLLPFTRHERLLERLQGARSLSVHGASPETRLLLALAGPVPTRSIRWTPSPHPIWPWAKEVLGSYGMRASSVATGLWAALRRPDVVLYTMEPASAPDGQDARIEGLYRALAERGLRVRELPWSTSLTRSSRNMLRRGRVALLPPSFRRPRLVNLPTGETVPHGRPDDRVVGNLAAEFLLPLAEETAWKIHRLRKLLARARPRGVLLIDDHRRTFEVAAAATLAGLPTVAIQHGQFNLNSVGLMGRGFDGPRRHGWDRYVVWSPFFSDILTRGGGLFPPESVVVGGPPRHSGPAGEARPAQDAVPRALFVVEQYDARTQAQLVDPFLHALVADAAIQTTLRPHPSVVPAAAAAFPSLPRDTRPLAQALGSADVVVASFSTVVFDAIRAPRPVVLFPTRHYDDPHGLARNGLALLARRPEDLPGLVKAAAATPAAELQRRRDLVWGSAEAEGGRVAVRLLLELADARP